MLCPSSHPPLLSSPSFTVSCRCACAGGHRRTALNSNLPPKCRPTVAAPKCNHNATRFYEYKFHFVPATKMQPGLKNETKMQPKLKFHFAPMCYQVFIRIKLNFPPTSNHHLGLHLSLSTKMQLGLKIVVQSASAGSGI